MAREKSEREWVEMGRLDPRIGIPDHYSWLPLAKFCSNSSYALHTVMGLLFML